MAKYVTVVRKARFVYSGFTALQMQGFAQVLADSIKGRIQSAVNIYDLPASPLKPGQPGRQGYPDYKSRRGIEPTRNWTWTGHTLKSLKVLDVSENRATIGFLQTAFPGRPATASQVAFYNNRREPQWGVSPRDRAAVVAAIEKPKVTVETKAA
jgi:hypothetical protein